MAVRRAPERDRLASRSIPFGDRLTRYDLILVAIPVALVLSLLAHVAVGVPLRATLAPAAVVGALAIVDGVFRNPPTTGGRRSA